LVRRIWQGILVYNNFVAIKGGIMTLSEIITMFRTENPEITDRVISDALLKQWAKTGDKEICAITRCIVTDATFSSVATTSVYTTRYNLTSQINKFYDIDDYPGGGVSFDDDPLEKTTIAELDQLTPNWRTRSAGTPKKYYRRGQYLYFDRPVQTAGLEIRVYAVLISNDFTDDNQEPYNELSYLEPFHYGINKYLQWKAKEKVGKPNEGLKAKSEFFEYANWMKKMIGGGKYSPIRYEKKLYY
jgi:hypothetical protein